MSIKARIGLALGIVLLLHVSTALMGHIGLERAQRDLTSYEAANADTIEILEIDREITELQRSVSLYMLTGQESAAERVRILRSSTASRIESAIKHAGTRPETEALREMGERITAYGQNFEKVAQDRETRSRLVRDEITPASKQILDLLTVAESVSPESAEVATEIAISMLRVETEVFCYFDSPDGKSLDDAFKFVGHTRNAIDRLENSEIKREFHTLLSQYERAFLNATQATRGYLHLVNVILAGEAAELYVLSSSIRAGSLDERQHLFDSIEAGATRFQIFSDSIAAFTVLAGIITASLMTRSVLRPILGIAETFRRLARGDREAEIIGLERTDEIGEMSKAAEVFRVKNIETENLLSESQRMGHDLERRNVEMTQFVYSVSHDLKTPMVTIRGYSGLIKEAMDQGNMEDIQSAIVRIDLASARMVRTIDDILALSRSGHPVIEQQELDLNSVCNDVLADLSSTIQDGNVEIEIQPDLPTLIADETRIRQILQNLVINAIIHGKPAKKPAKIQIKAHRIDGNFVLSVCDNGEGIKQEFQPKVFGIFQRLSVEQPGTGVGLAIVKAAAESHGGRAWVESEPGEGATFSVSIPDRPSVMLAKSA